MEIEKTTTIPKPASKKQWVHTEWKYLEVGNRVCYGAYDKKQMIKISSYIFYWNKINKPKKLVQRKVEDKMYVYREK